jgi:hypothetical protein
MKKRIGCLIALLVIIGIAFVPGNASALDITLAWDANTEPNLGGYMIYYDTDSSGEPYDGTGAMEGPSPIDVGNVLELTLTGLSDDLGTIYYFAATAYNTDDPPLESGYSNEVLSRCELIVTVTGSGVVVQVPPGNNGVQASGIEVALTAQPDQFWVFGEWGGDVTGTNPVGTIMMDGNNKAVTATFTETAQYTLTATTTGNGTVTFDPVGGTYHVGQTVSVTATADAGWAFSEWTGAISGTTNPHSIVISANATINAVFVVSDPPTAPIDIKVVVP